MTDLPVTAEPSPPAVPIQRREWFALGVVLALAAALALVNLTQQGMGNPYYAATVRSMLIDWRNFFFASFDPAGWVSVDKPPLGFWMQSLSASIFGYRGISLLLPQALATVGSVAMAWVITRRAFGPVAAILAALTLALTPITVAAGRTNTIDPLLVLTLMVAAWALLRAIERDSFGWMLASAALIGLGFNIKMLQAWLILPAWGLAWIVASRRNLPQRIGILAASGALALVVSVSWMSAVEGTPPADRPYVGSSSTNSAFDLAFGYNGLQRLLPPSLSGVEIQEPGSAEPPSPGAILTAFGAIETGERGPLRLFNHFLAAQIAWLLPLAVLGGAIAWFREPGLISWPVSRSRTALIFWGGWLATAWAFFTVANQFHRYYLVMLGPPIALLCGAGLAALWAAWQGTGWQGWLLPVAIAGTGLLSAWITAPFGGTLQAFGMAIAAAAALSALALAAVRLRSERWKPHPESPDPAMPTSAPGMVATSAAVLGMAAMLAGPALWSGWSVVNPVSNTLPAAGPNGDLLAGFIPPPAAGADPSAPSPAAPSFDAYQPPDPALVAFLEAHHGGERFMLATGSAMSASPLIIERAMPVAALGGFVGQDPIVTPRGLAKLIHDGDLRYVLAPDPRKVNLLTTMTNVWGTLKGAGQQNGGGAPADPAAPDPTQFLKLFLTPNIRWVSENCQPVPTAEWQTPGRNASNPLAGLDMLYDCGALRD
ncbi:MAG: ArnT family glycosyltransferase [Thermomicrobiales bacterium]